MKKVLVIDDDDILLLLLKNQLTKAGYEVLTASDGITGLQMVGSEDPYLVITDFKMPGMSGIEIVQNLTKSHPGLPVIVLTAYDEVSLTIKSIQAGAYDFVVKPFQSKELLEVVRNGIQASVQSRSLSEVISTAEQKAIEDNLLVGRTPKMREIFKNIGRISHNKMSVLITGETGSGKEQVARLIHYSGITRSHPFIVVKCQGGSKTQLEQEIFGSAQETQDLSPAHKPGKIEMAGEGTLFLDAFHELPGNLQLRLHRVLHDMETAIPGREETIPVHSRIIVSSDQNLDDLLAQGKLLKELYYNLKVFTINIPPLRQRLDDLPDLVNNLIEKLNRKLNKKVLKIEEGLIEVLRQYDWPGNVGELENVLTQALILSRSDVLEKQHLHFAIPSGDRSDSEPPNLVALAEVEKIHILHVLNAVKWAKQEAASILDITRPTLNAKIEKYQLEKP